MTMTTANDSVCVKTKIFVCMVYGWIDVWLVGWLVRFGFFLVWFLLAYMVCMCMMHICTKMMIVFRVSSHQETLNDDHHDCEEDDDGVFRFSFQHFLFLIFVHHHRITKKKKPLHRKHCGLCESKFFLFFFSG